MSDSSSTSGSFIPATSVPDDIPRFRPLFPDDHRYPSLSGDHPPAISITTPSVPPNIPSNLDRGTETSEFLYGRGSLFDADREDQELRSLLAAHFTRQEERETKFATEVTSILVTMNAQLNVLNGSFDALNGAFSRQEGLLAAILSALQTRNSSS